MNWFTWHPYLWVIESFSSYHIELSCWWPWFCFPFLLIKLPRNTLNCSWCIHNSKWRLRAVTPFFAAQQTHWPASREPKSIQWHLVCTFRSSFCPQPILHVFRQVAKRKVTWVFRKWSVPVLGTSPVRTLDLGPFHHRTQEYSEAIYQQVK